MFWSSCSLLHVVLSLNPIFFFLFIKKWNCMRNTAISAAFVNCLKVWVNAHPGQLCCIHNNLKVSLDTHRDQFCSTHNCVKDWLDRHHDLFRYFHSSGNVWLDVHWDYLNCITLYQQSEIRSESGPCPVLLYSWQKLRALFATSDRIASPNKVTRIAVKGHFGMLTYQSDLYIFLCYSNTTANYIVIKFFNSRV